MTAQAPPEAPTSRLPSPAGTATPPGSYHCWDDYMRDVEQAAQPWHDDTSLQVGKAMRLAPALAVFRALLAGQVVPVAALDAEWARRYGLL